MPVSSSTAIFMLSLLGIPITYIVNLSATFHGPLALMLTGSVLLLFLCLATFYVVKREGTKVDFLYYVFILGTFASVVDLITALENDGFIHGFMTHYLKEGEPYLKTAYGTIICYWDGIAHYGMYIMMLSALAWNQSFREVGLFWAGSIGVSMVVLIPGCLISKSGPSYATLLNVPYMVVPFAGCARFLSERTPIPNVKRGYKPIIKRPLDVLFIIGFIVSTIIAVCRALPVLGSTNETLRAYVDNIEPYLKDPWGFPKIQMCVYFFYFIPYYVIAIYGLLTAGCEWMPDWALIHAGAAAHSQIAHIFSSSHFRTPYPLRVPYNPISKGVFFSVNLLLLIMPQLFAYRCQKDRSLFALGNKELSSGTKSEKKE